MLTSRSISRDREGDACPSVEPECSAIPAASLSRERSATGGTAASRNASRPQRLPRYSESTRTCGCSSAGNSVRKAGTVAARSNSIGQGQHPRCFPVHMSRATTPTGRGNPRARAKSDVESPQILVPFLDLLACLPELPREVGKRRRVLIGGWPHHATQARVPVGRRERSAAGPPRQVRDNDDREFQPLRLMDRH